MPGRAVLPRVLSVSQRDNFAILIAGPLLLSLAAYFDVYDRFHDFSDAYAHWNPGDLLIGGSMISVLVSALAARRVLGRRRPEATPGPTALVDTRFRGIVEDIPAAIYTTPLVTPGALAGTGVANYMSPQIEGMLGYRPEEWLACSDLWSQSIHPDDRERVLSANEQSNATGDPTLLEYRIIARDGRIVWVRDEAALMRDDAGVPLFWRGFLVDITERKRAEEALEASEKRFRSTFDGAALAMTISSTHGECIEVNQAMCDMLGYTAEELLALPPYTLTLPDDREETERVVGQLATGAVRSAQVTKRYVRRDGAIVTCLVTVSATTGDDGQPLYYLTQIQDISDQTRVEQALRAAEHKYRTLVEQSPAATYVYRAENGTMVTYMSPQIERITGYAPQRWVDDPGFWLSIVHPDDRDRTREEIERTDATGEPYRIEHRYVRRDGEIVWVRNEAEYIVSEDGTQPYWQGCIVDITERKQAEEDFRRLSAEYQHIVDDANDIIVSYDTEGRFTFVNRRFCEVTGYSEQEALELNVANLIHPDDLPMVADNIRRRLAGEPVPRNYTFRAVTRDGRVLYVDSNASLVVEDGCAVGIQSFVRDITDRLEAEEALRRSEERFRFLVEASSDMMSILDPQGTFLYESASIEPILGYRAEDLIGVNAFAYVHPDDLDHVLPIFERLVSQPEARERVEFRFRHADGSWRWMESTGRNLLHIPAIAGIVVNSRDITERKQLEDDLVRQAFYDTLTSLPNRALLLERLSQSLLRLQREPNTIALLFLDLDNFKVINDSLGHATGDQLLVDVAERLRRAVRETDTVSRFGGDEFAILLEPVESAAVAAEVAGHIISAFQPPFFLDGRPVIVSPSIGIAVSSSGGDRPGDLLRWADIAMYEAKGKGKNQMQVYRVSEHDSGLRRLELEHELRHTIERGEFTLHYQPEYDLATGDMVGVEALVRWQHPRLGLISPAEFIPTAEETGLIIPVGEWVVREACRQVRQWLDEYQLHPAFTVGVNLSARQFRQPDLARRIEAILKETGLVPQRLLLEITESTVMDDVEHAASVLRDLCDLGVQVAIDDFGTGYSSLAHLKRFPVTFLKIDRTFVNGLGVDSSDTTLVSSIIGLAHGMNLRVIAEGIETAEQVEHLRALECNLGQGYFFATPLPPVVMSEMLATQFQRSYVPDTVAASA